jgi:hypothetical protein
MEHKELLLKSLSPQVHQLQQFHYKQWEVDMVLLGHLRILDLVDLVVMVVAELIITLAVLSKHHQIRQFIHLFRELQLFMEMLALKLHQFMVLEEEVLVRVV